MVKKKVIFVCTGNTCRSSMAQALAENILQQMDTSELEIEIASAGTTALPGMPAAENAIKVLSSMGIDLKGHSASLLTPEDVQSADLILTMTGMHRRQVRSMVPGCENKIFTLAEYARVGADVPDPIGGPEETYRACAREMQTMVKQALQEFLYREKKDKPD
ncbi:MAG: low molecular weight protein arginine phosphatase [Firmicutes bacterium]|nr:low molecular weight protein arginine phosphatase [Bacillota bacterium]